MRFYISTTPITISTTSFKFGPNYDIQKIIEIQLSKILILESENFEHIYKTKVVFVFTYDASFHFRLLEVIAVGDMAVEVIAMVVVLGVGIVAAIGFLIFEIKRVSRMTDKERKKSCSVLCFPSNARGVQLPIF